VPITVVIYAMVLEPTALTAICKIQYFRILKTCNIFVRKNKINLKQSPKHQTTSNLGVPILSNNIQMIFSEGRSHIAGTGKESLACNPP
jgi:hypothetical protein